MIFKSLIFLFWVLKYLCTWSCSQIIYASKVIILSCNLSTELSSWEITGFFFFNSYGSLPLGGKLYFCRNTWKNSTFPTLKTTKITLLLWLLRESQISKVGQPFPYISTDLRKPAIFNTLCFSVFVPKLRCYCPVSWVANRVESLLHVSVRTPKALLIFYFI